MSLNPAKMSSLKDKLDSSEKVEVKVSPAKAVKKTDELVAKPKAKT